MWHAYIRFHPELFNNWINVTPLCLKDGKWTRLKDDLSMKLDENNAEKLKYIFVDGNVLEMKKMIKDLGLLEEIYDNMEKELGFRPTNEEN